MDAKAILARLTEIEASQRRFADDVAARHEKEMAEVRKRIEAAEQTRKQAELEASRVIMPAAPPVLMQINMSEVEAAVQAAAASAQESTRLRDEAKNVAEQAKLASGALPMSGMALLKGGEVGFGPDNEYIVKKVSVNLDDVEKAINRSPVVERCKAFGRPDAKYGNEVYCAVVPKRNIRVSEPMLMIYAQKYLPTAMVPKRFFLLEDLPIGITRKALAEISISDLGRTKAPRKALSGPAVY